MKKHLVSEFMNPDVVCAHPEMTVSEVERILVEREISGMPVVDDSGRLLGVVSQRDLVRHESTPRTVGESGQFFTDVEDYAELQNIRERGSRPVTEVMRPEVFTVDRDAPADEAARLMRVKRVHRLIVTKGETLVGIVSTLDLLRIVENPD